MLKNPERTQLIDLLVAKTAGIPAAFFSFSTGNDKAFSAYGNLVKKLPDIERETLINLLEATDANSAPEIYGLLMEDEAFIQTHKKFLELTARWSTNPNKRKIATLPAEETETFAINPNLAKSRRDKT
ncbi:MAG: hypothetical protein K0R08_371 [Solimicrobium sp.]|nr:hypothetical protein [Solimicrobium sp.]